MSLKKKRRKLLIKKYVLEFLQIILGTFIMAIGVSCFLLPNQLSSGGFTGIATIFYYLLHLPMGITIFALNLPLFILSWIKKGREFFIKGLIGTTALSLFIDLLDKFNAITRRSPTCMYIWWSYNWSRNIYSVKSKCIYRWNRYVSIYYTRI